VFQRALSQQTHSDLHELLHHLFRLVRRELELNWKSRVALQLKPIGDEFSEPHG